MRARSFVLLALANFITPILLGAQDNDHTSRWLQNCENAWSNDRGQFCEVRNFALRP